METTEILKMGIGTQEKNIALKPTKAKIVSITLKTKKNDGTDMPTPIAQINVKHPDREELLAMNKVKLERSGKLQVVTTWVQTTEEDGKEVISKGSSLTLLMDFLGVKTLEETIGKDVDLIAQATDDPYLCIKAY
jgi:hypothetical protein